MLASSPVAPAAASLVLSGVAHDFVVRGDVVPALGPLDLALAPGEFVSVIGPSGCGKSTLLRVAAGLLRPARGEVRIDGAPPANARRAKRLGVAFQDPALLPWRSVRENVRLALDVNARREAPAADLDELLALVGLAEYRDYYPHQLSGGMKQRAALARALVTRPALLLLDEPFGALDDLTRTELRYELLRLHRRLRPTVLLITHSIDEAALLSDRVVVMAGPPGRIAAVVEADLPASRTAATEESAAFHHHVRRLRAALREA
jgi:NitT/TauT family transport system ATP-binding protein